MSCDVEHECAMCGAKSNVVGVLIGNDPKKMLCDDCILSACERYAAHSAIPMSMALDVMRYRQALRRIAQRQKAAEEEMRKAEAENPDVAQPNRGLDVKPS